MKKKTAFILLIFCATVLVACRDRKAIIDTLRTEIDTTTINFKYENFGNALTEAKETNKPILMYITQDGCAWCLKMEKEVFSDFSLQNSFNKNFICAKVHLRRTGPVMKTGDYNKLNKSEIAFMKLYKIQLSFPTFVIMNPDGKLISKESKFMNIQEFIQFGTDGQKI
jgi:thioredoxin-related protein